MLQRMAFYATHQKKSRFEKGISKKEITINEDRVNMDKKEVYLGYHEVIPVTGNILITRIDKSVGLINNG